MHLDTEATYEIYKYLQNQRCIIWENIQSIWKIESHLERLPKGQKALEWLKGLKLGWVVEVGDGQGGWVIRKP